MNKEEHMNNLVAKASITTSASLEKVWDALVNPDAVKQYMFGTTLTTNWREGGSISWKGEWEGKPYEDTGTVLNFDPETQLQFDHYSPMTGPDTPENHHVVTIDLSREGNQTRVSLTQDNNATEEAREHSEKNWTMMLEGLKRLVETGKA
jgi:uncharacterized protein YndB with AHSA1/START domain